jgi:LPXTG-motif cell wall-anchored protein
MIMYTTGSGVLTASATSTGAAVALAQTGLASAWLAVAGVAIITVGIFLLRMVPKDEF